MRVRVRKRVRVWVRVSLSVAWCNQPQGAHPFFKYTHGLSLQRRVGLRVRETGQTERQMRTNRKTGRRQRQKEDRS